MSSSMKPLEVDFGSAVLEELSGHVRTSPSLRTLVWRMRHLLVLVALTVAQGAAVGPSYSYIKLTFFSKKYVDNADCELQPSSRPCRQAAADVALYKGVSHSASSSIAWLAALGLGSYSDSVGRTPLIRAKAVMSLLPVFTLGLYIFLGVTLWVNLVVHPLYEAFDTNGVFLAVMSDVVVEPEARATGFAVVGGTVLLSVVLVLPFAGRMSSGTVVAFALITGGIKLGYLCLVFPETAPLASSTAPRKGSRAAAKAAWLLLTRNSIIFRMAMVLVVSGFATAGFGTTIQPYLTGYLGMGKEQTVQSAVVLGISVIVVLALLMRPLNRVLGEVNVLRVSLATCSAFPLLCLSCVTMADFMVLSGACAGFFALHIPLISSIKSNLVASDEQGLMQGVLAAVKVVAVAIAQVLFSWLFNLSTNHGTSPNRISAWPPFVLSSFLAALALAITCTLPVTLPPVQGTESREGKEHVARCCGGSSASCSEASESDNESSTGIGEKAHSMRC